MRRGGLGPGPRVLRRAGRAGAGELSWGRAGSSVTPFILCLPAAGYEPLKNKQTCFINTYLFWEGDNVIQALGVLLRLGLRQRCEEPPCMVLCPLLFGLSEGAAVCLR